MIPLILLKVPILYVLDELFKISFALPEFGNALRAAYSNNDTVHDWRAYTPNTFGQTENYVKFMQHYSGFILATSKITICWFIFVSMIFLIFLSTKNTHIMYLQIISIIVVIASGWANIKTLKILSVKLEQFDTDQIKESTIWEKDGIMNSLMVQRIGDILFVIFCNFVIQLSLSLAFEYFQKYTESYLNYRIFSSCFAIPTVFTFIPCTWDALNIISVLFTLYPLCKMLFLNIYYTVGTIVANALKVVSHYLMKDFGMHILISKVWNRLEMPFVFRIFWTMRVIEKLLYLLANTKMANQSTYDIVTYLLTDGCDTLISLSGMISYISYFCHYLEILVQKVLMTNVVADRHIEVVSTVFLYLLAFITRLTGLEPDERITQLFQNVCIVWTILLSYFYRKCYTILVFVFFPNNKRNIRAVMVCGFIISFAVTMLTYLWFYHSLSRFSLLVSTLNIQIILKVLVSLAIHALFVLDAYSLSLWIDTEDYVFYIQMFESMIDFGLNIFILLVSVYTKWWCDISSIFLIALLASHFYESIWCRFRREWRLFVNRRSAIRKIESMLDATSEQLTEYDSFCAICYENMDAAKVTNCNHYFHGTCLRKWLYINGYCPMCLQQLFNIK